MNGAHLFPPVTLRPTPLGAHAEQGRWLALTYVRHRLCGLKGHDLLLHFERRRLCLQCADCGWQSPGWDIGQPLSSVKSEACERGDRNDRVSGGCPRLNAA
jgi:hypothetical protein